MLELDENSQLRLAQPTQSMSDPFMSQFSVEGTAAMQLGEAKSATLKQNERSDLCIISDNSTEATRSNPSDSLSVNLKVPA